MIQLLRNAIREGKPPPRRPIDLPSVVEDLAVDEVGDDEPRSTEALRHAVRALARRGSFQCGRGKWHVYPPGLRIR